METETPLSTTLGLALREIRNRPKGFGIFLLCLVLGVGAVAGIGTLSAALDAGIRNNTRAILGGDLELRQAHAPIPDIAVEAFRAFGATSRVASLRAMARGPGGASTLTELKAVDQDYPLYGQARLRSGADLQAVLATRENEPEAEPKAVAEAGLLARIGAGVGDLIVVGDAAFRVVDVLEREPDKAAGFFGLGPRLMISLDDLEATGLVQPGSLIRYAVRLALPLFIIGEMDASLSHHAAYGDPLLPVLAVGLAVLVGLTASVYPALMASRMDPNEALRAM